MELRQLEYFVVLADELHFTRAASRLHIVQSALSASVRSLEHELGSTLLWRSSKRVELTEAGRAFLPEARRTLAAADVARDAIAAVEGVLSGTLTVGFMQASESYRLPRLLAEFHRRHPGVQLRLRNLASADLVDEVRSHRLGLAFASTPHHPPPGLSQDTLVEADMVLACSADHELHRVAAVELAALAAEPFIDFTPGWGVRQATDQLFTAVGIDRTTAFEVNDIPLFVDLLREGLGVGFLPPAIADRFPDLGSIATTPAPLWRLGIIYPAGDQITPAARAMVDLIHESSDLGVPRR